MAFEVLVTLKAEQDIDEYTEFIALDSKVHAAKWKASLAEKILSLAQMPKRFSVIAEADHLGVAYRSFT